MLVCFGLFGLLLYNTVVANAVCSFTYSHRDEIRALSLQYQQKGYKKCEYHIRAPRNNFVVLNFTSLFGFRPQSSMTTGNLQSARSPDYDSDSCLPPEVILKEKSEGNKVHQIGKLCTNSNNLLGPKVFHSKLNVIKITYVWVENHSSGFTVDFDFHHYNNSCVDICDERVCLSDNQLCNGQYDCVDESDEHNCLPQITGASQPSATNVDVIKAFAVIISIVLMPGLFIIICVVNPCRLRSRMWRRGRRSRERIEHSQLRTDSQISEVVYVPSSGPSPNQDKLLEQRISPHVREHSIRVRSVQTDTMLDLPPQIPVSKDGEEGYIESQKHLYCKRNRYLVDQLFRPPPNRTVHDRESPPPYYSNSASLENLDTPQTRIVKDANGCSRVLRCYSMSASDACPSASKSRKSVQQQAAKSHHRTMSTNSGGERSRTVSASKSYNEQTDEPPDYSRVLPSDINCAHVDSSV